MPDQKTGGGGADDKARRTTISKETKGWEDRSGKPHAGGDRNPPKPPEKPEKR